MPFLKHVFLSGHLLFSLTEILKENHIQLKGSLRSPLLMYFADEVKGTRVRPYNLLVTDNLAGNPWLTGQDVFAMQFTIFTSKLTIESHTFSFI